MKPTQLTVLLLATLVLTTPQGAQTPTEKSDIIPERLYSRFSPEIPLWISAATVDAEGLTALPPQFTSKVQHYREAAALLAPERDDCMNSSVAPTIEYATPPPEASFDSIINKSLALLVGTVERVEPGFYYYFPGTLLQLKVTDILIQRSNLIAPLTKGSVVYLFHPGTAHFDAAGVAICQVNLVLPTPPEVGRRVVVFPFSDPADEDGILLYPNLDNFLVERPDGTVESSAVWANVPELAATTSIDAFVRLAKSALEKEK